MSSSSPRLDLDEIARLEEERDHLLASLEDLDREFAAGDMDELDHRTLRDDYTTRAAAVLEALDQQHAALRAAAAYDSPALTAALLRGYPRYDAEERTVALSVLASRPASAAALVPSPAPSTTSAPSWPGARRSRSSSPRRASTATQRSWPTHPTRSRR